MKTVIEYRTNEKGEKVKVTRKVREYKTVRKVSKRVEERRKVLVSFPLGILPPHAPFLSFPMIYVIIFYFLLLLALDMLGAIIFPFVRLSLLSSALL